MAQFGMSVAQSANHHIITFKGLHHHTVLHGLGEYALHLTIAIAHITRILAHSAYIESAKKHKHWQYANGDKRQIGIHVSKIAESTNEERNNGKSIGQGFSDKHHYAVDIHL